MTKETLNTQLKLLPDTPGVYQFYNDSNVVIYVGKAKNLKRRVSSYFNREHDNAKTRILVRNIKEIKHIVVDTETDALLLENNLIKQYQPRYNILLKDDKTYPWICIKKERFPRIFTTRRVIKDGSEYFGPYTNVKTVYALLDLIKELYNLRTCNYDLSENNILNYKYKVCLEYHIGNCEGACEGYEEEEHYLQKIQSVKQILKGNFKQSLGGFKLQMQKYAEELKFEAAQKIKDKLLSLENYQSKSTIVNSKISNVDVFSIVSDDSYAYVNFLQISYGSIIRAHTVEIKKKLDETEKEVLTLAIVQLRDRYNSLSKEIILPFELEQDLGVKITVPQLGDKKKILELSERNAKYFKLEKIKQVKITDPDRHVKRIMSQMKQDLRLSKEPVHIECFDNSNIQGTNPVAACVVFKNGKPSKKDYRHFNIKTVDGPDDFSSMEEVVYRRYKRLLDENQSLPQLIVIDGGKGQLSSALKSLDDLGLRGKIAIVGIAKRLEEIYFPGDSVPLYLDKRSESLKIIQYLRNEAHRFGITHHRNKRSNSSLNSELELIDGIGPKTIESLLQKFKSVKRIKEESLERLAIEVGESKAKKIISYFEN